MNQSMLARPRKPGWDTYLVGLLAFAHLRILAFGEQVGIPLDMRLNDVLRHPILGNLLPSAGEEALGSTGPLPVEPIGLLLHAITIGFVLLYFIADLLPAARTRGTLKWTVLTLLICTALFLPTAKLMLLRNISGPASYTHDGGVIQTEATIDYILAGKNPYVEEYVDTPMGEWGLSKYRTALYHYPYLPWTFLFSTIFYLIGQLTGFYDQRLVYLLLMAIALALAPRLATSQRNKLALVAAIGLNPLMGIDIIFGQNDSFVLCWILFSLVCLQQFWKEKTAGKEKSVSRVNQQTNTHTSKNKKWLIASSLLFGLACASKPTAWFFAPFYGLLLVRSELTLPLSELSIHSKNRVSTVVAWWSQLLSQIPLIVYRAGPALAVFAALLIPFILWDAYAFYDDVWRWSNGQGETGYQIWGWGLSNFVLGFGLVEDRFSQWPFLLTQAVIAGPLLLWSVYRQMRENTIAAACWHYALLLLGFFYASRFLNENYLGYIIAFLSIGLCGTLNQNQETDIPNGAIK